MTIYDKQTLFRVLLFLPVFSYLFWNEANSTSLYEVVRFLLSIIGWRTAVFCLQEIFIPYKEK